jgi:hypothetical protein
MFISYWMQTVCYVRQIEIHIDNPLEPDSSSIDVEMAITKLQKHKSSESDQISV